MSASYYNTAGVFLAEVNPLENNGVGNQSTPRQIIDVEFLDKAFATPTDAFVVNDDVTSRFVQGFKFEVVGGGAYAGSYVVNATGFANGASVVQLVDGKSHIPVANIVSPAVPYSFFTGFTSPSISPTTPNTYLVTWQVAGNTTAVMLANASIQLKNIIYNGKRVNRVYTIVSAVYNVLGYTNVVTSITDTAPTMPVISVDTRSTVVSPVPANAPYGYVQYTIPFPATSLKLTGKGAALFNNTTTWGTALQSNQLHMLENFAYSLPPVAPMSGQLWYDTAPPGGGTALQLLTNTKYTIIAANVVSKIWTISGNQTAVASLQVGKKVVVYNDTGLAATSFIYTITANALNGANTNITVAEAITGAVGNGVMYAYDDWHGVLVEGLPTQGNLDMNSYKIARLASPATTFPYIASTTGWGNNGAEAVNLQTADTLYIAKTGGSSAVATDRSGTMTGSLNINGASPGGASTIGINVNTAPISMYGASDLAFMSGGSGNITFQSTSTGVINMLGTGGITVAQGNIVATAGNMRVGSGTNQVVTQNNASAAPTITFTTSTTANNVINLSNNMITGLSNAVGVTDAVSLQFADGRYVNVTGDTMTGALAMNGATANITLNAGDIILGAGGNTVSILNNGTAAGSIIFDTSTASTTSGNVVINLGNNKLTGLSTPTTSQDATNKAYVDMFVNGIIWITPVLDPSLFDDSLSAPPTIDAFTQYHKSYIVAGTGTGAWAGFNGHLMTYDGTAWQSVLGRAVAVGDRLGVFMEPDNDDPLVSMPAGGLLNQAGKIAEVLTVSPYTYSFYTPSEPDAVSVKGIPGSTAFQSPHMGHSYTFRGQHGIGSYGTGFKWIEFSGPQMIIDGAGLRYTGNTLNVDGNVLSLYNLATTGIIARTGVDTVTSRTITGTTNNIVVTNGDGVAGNPTLNLATVTQGSTGTTFTKTAIDGFGRVTSNSAVLSADIIASLGYTPVNKAGDTMTGLLVLSADPAVALGAATKQYVDNTTVSLTGDTMTGALTVPTIIGGSTATSDLVLQTTSGVGGAGADMHFLVGNNGSTEALTILNNGNIGVGTINPQTRLSLASGSAISFEASAGVTDIALTHTADTLSLSGGVLAMGTNKITNLGDPTTPQDAATKQYVDNTTVSLTGDTMTGLLVLSGDPAVALGAATKQYVDTNNQVGYQYFAVSTEINGLGTITPGTLYTNGTYNNVPLTGGTGTGATANITVTGGGVSAVTIVNRGVGYTAGDTLSAAAANIGGTGSGFSVPVSTTRAQTVFTLSAFSYVLGSRRLMLFVNGVKQVAPTNGNYTETTTTSFTFSPVLTVGDQLEAYHV